MALDGVFLHFLKKEIEDVALQAKVDKIYQPNRDEIVLAFRGKNQNVKLLLSSRANSPRVHFTEYKIENPATPPMLCMLLRKRLTGARLEEIEQFGLERVLCLKFDALNELGDRITLKLYAEIMGKYSNIVLTDGEDIIIDAIHRVDSSMSSQRLILPGIKYVLPPAQEKLDIMTANTDAIMDKIYENPKLMLSKAILGTLQGFSPLVCRELAHASTYGKDDRIELLSESVRERLKYKLSALRQSLEKNDGIPVIIKDRQGRPMDFSFMSIHQYATEAVTSELPSFSQLLDMFYAQKDSVERMRVRSHDILRILTSASERLSRKLNVQKVELESCADREQKKMYGDLINANLYRIEKGSLFADLENYYDDMKTVRIPLDPSLTAAQNAQKYYKEYRKAQTASRVLVEQIEKGEAELQYIDSVFDCLSRAENERELAEIRQELAEQGYLKLKKTNSRKQPAALEPIEFLSSDGFKILVGRNNKQNDKLTLKSAAKNDIWMHTKNIPGSHTIIVTGGKQVPAKTMEEAAALAAYHSRAKDSALVPVDYTLVRNVKKPQGAKPGMVIYENYKTIYIDPGIFGKEEGKQ